MERESTGPGHLIKQLKLKADRPDRLDALCTELGAPSNLFNVHLALRMNVPGLGDGIYIPVMISKDRGGRPSGLQIRTNDETLMGMHVNGSSIGLRYWTRLSGNSDIAAEGDSFRERWVALSGKTISEGVGQITSVDFSRGQARAHFKTRLGALGIGDINIPDTECECDAVVILWTLVCWGDCTCKPAEVA